MAMDKYTEKKWYTYLVDRCDHQLCETHSDETLQMNPEDSGVTLAFNQQGCFVDVSEQLLLERSCINCRWHRCMLRCNLVNKENASQM